jgi:hypothetical protein
MGEIDSAPCGSVCISRPLVVVSAPSPADPGEIELNPAIQLGFIIAC